MVRAELAPVEPGVMAAGEKTQRKLLGRSLQESEMELLNELDCGVALTVKIPDWPAAIVTLDGDALKVMVDNPFPEPHAGE